MTHAQSDLDVSSGAWPPLPDLFGHRGKARRVGVEVEFGGLKGDRAIEILRGSLGGEAHAPSAAEWRLKGSALGNVKLYLDTALRPSGTSTSAQVAVDMARAIVPLEIVTEPLDQADLPRLDAALDALARNGAEGSTERLAYGFGLHLNPGLADSEAGADLPRGALAFALLEPWLRARDPLDLSRRVLPFTAPFPPAFGDALAAAGPSLDLGTLYDALDAHVTDRNHGLDLLPAYAHFAPDRFAAREASAGAVSARPTYHYRMAETRLGVPGWSLAYEWRRWVLVETVAADGALLEQLCTLRGDLRDVPLLPAPESWQKKVSDVLGPLAALAPAGGPGVSRPTAPA